MEFAYAKGGQIRRKQQASESHVKRRPQPSEGVLSQTGAGTQGDMGLCAFPELQLAVPGTRVNQLITCHFFFVTESKIQGFRLKASYDSRANASIACFQLTSGIKI